MLNEFKETKQEFTSQNTCKHMVNSVYKIIDFQPNSVILDYGCGKFDSNELYIKELNRNLTFFKYDKYNVSKEENLNSINACMKRPPEYIICSNVLNVIKEDEIVEEVVANIALLADAATKIYFEIYECHGDGCGCKTVLGYQRNQKVKDYLPFLEKYFEVSMKKKYLICRKKVEL